MKNKLTGYVFILAAITFWISWFLMPDPGTTDANHILQIVKESRMNVLSSVIIQIISSVLYVIALFGLTRDFLASKKIKLIGVILLGIGALGLCADAFFHLLAFFMTDNSVNIQKDVVRTMKFMQTTGVVFLLPLLLPLFIGSLVLSNGMKKQGMISKSATVIFIVAFSIAILGGISSNAFHFTIPGLSLIVLALFAAGQIVIGFELNKRQRLPKTIKILKKNVSISAN